ncbi:unnamed protein product, partial [Lampetra fluviatilis]
APPLAGRAAPLPLIGQAQARAVARARSRVARDLHSFARCECEWRDLEPSDRETLLTQHVGPTRAGNRVDCVDCVDCVDWSTPAATAAAAAAAPCFAAALLLQLAACLRLSASAAKMGRKKNKAGNSAPANGTESSDKSQPDRGKKKAQAAGQGPSQGQGQGAAGPPCLGQAAPAALQAELQSKGPKQYSFGSSQQPGEVDNSVLKISLPPDLERRILELINARRSEQLAPEGSASRRLTNKKLL